VGAQVCVFSLFILYATEAEGINQIKAADLLGICGIAFLIGRFLGTALMKFFKPNNLLAFYAAANVLLSIVAIMAHGYISIYAIIGICFFMSIMFPTIFSLGIRDLRGDTEYGSSLIIMAIVGGAILPRIFGMIADATGNIKLGYIVPMVCFAIVFLFGWKGYKVKEVEEE
jgi:FHS family L-fucose permease-like MFS transporter